ncbi:hypothetical protein LB559_09020 [Mesorhizobium sp. BR1-1-3]|uniref:hypothetical protein n=1 Tax=Mesorhizobium sp. BR1-1-3 TaxID=2876651 RepID=UPI001CD16E97|nr:hypothetical protein [Mesorhizobium sp. BR1-1-3]MBZ9888079.1 hypothetical protein [Mesorhizobium sp. BR1-1-3]
MKLTETQKRSLIECVAMGEGWWRSQHLSGTKAERSSTTLLSLVALGLLEGEKNGGNKQGQYHWRVTDLGRLALSSVREP